MFVFIGVADKSVCRWVVQTLDVFILMLCHKCLVTLLFFRIPCELNDEAFCVQAAFLYVCSVFTFCRNFRWQSFFMCYVFCSSKNGWTILSTQEFWWRVVGVTMRSEWSVCGGISSQLPQKLSTMREAELMERVTEIMKTQRVASVVSAVGF